MRLVFLDEIKTGDILAKDIISSEGTVLLRKGTKYRTIFEHRLKEIKIKSVYIDDELSRGIEPQLMFDNEIKESAMSTIKGEFRKLLNGAVPNEDAMNSVSEMLINKVYSSEILYEIQDIRRNDQNLYEHSLGTAIIALLICKKLNSFTLDEIKPIVTGALLHDIGKILIDKKVLNKPDKLNSEEFEHIKTHSEIGFKMVTEDMPHIHPITKLCILCHHEREDGSGYPLGTRGDLHIAAKIVGCADVFNALTSDRAYRAQIETPEVIAIMRREKLNLEIRETLESLLTFYPVGTTVILSNGFIAIVEKNFSGNTQRPLVRTFKNFTTGEEKINRIDLRTATEVEIIARYPKHKFN